MFKGNIQSQLKVSEDRKERHFTHQFNNQHWEFRISEGSLGKLQKNLHIFMTGAMEPHQEFWFNWSKVLRYVFCRFLSPAQYDRDR